MILLPSLPRGLRGDIDIEEMVCMDHEVVEGSSYNFS